MAQSSQLAAVNEKYWKSQRRSFKDEHTLPIRVCYYGRVSTDHFSQIQAFDNQSQYYAMLGETHKNWITVAEFSDVSTGTNTNRQGFTDMIQMAMRGEIDLIVTRDWSRWGRNLTENVKYVRMLRELGTEVYAVSDGTWSFSEDSDFTMGLMSVFSENESRRISTKVKAGQMVSRNKHVLYGNGLILGYDLVKGSTSEENHYVINPQQAEVVKRIYELYSENYGLSKIVKILTEENRLNSNGGCKFSPTYLCRILSNEVYTGKLCYNKSYKPDMLSKRVVNRDKSTHVYIPSPKVPQIISDELFAKVASIRDSKKRKDTGKAQCTHISNEKYMSRMRCNCSKTYKRYMWREVAGQPVYGYKCRNVADTGGRAVDGMVCKMPSFPQWHLDLQWYNIINNTFDNPEQTAKKVMKLIDKLGIHDERYSAITKQITLLQKEKDKVSSRKESLQNKWLDNLLDNDEYKRLSEGLNTEITELENKIEGLRVEIGQEDKDRGIKVATLQRVEAALLGSDNFSELNYDNDEFFKAMVARITVMPDRCYRWYLNIGSGKGWGIFSEKNYELYDNFTISFEEARRYRKRTNKYVRRNQYTPIKVEIYIRTK